MRRAWYLAGWGYVAVSGALVVRHTQHASPAPRPLPAAPSAVVIPPLNIPTRRSAARAARAVAPADRGHDG